jgi:DNA-binding GntR family transcriptional regulator
LSVDQKNLLVWSRMYDNIQESMECPSDKVIEDDDALDGWFIEQRRKNEREKAIAVVEDSIQNDKIKNSQEVIVFTDNKTDANTVHEMNSPNAKVIKQERKQVVKEKGSAVDLDFADQKMKLGNMAHEQFKNKFRR